MRCLLELSSGTSVWPRLVSCVKDRYVVCVQRHPCTCASSLELSADQHARAMHQLLASRLRRSSKILGGNSLTLRVRGLQPERSVVSNGNQESHGLQQQRAEMDIRLRSRRRGKRGLQDGASGGGSEVEMREFESSISTVRSPYALE